MPLKISILGKVANRDIIEYSFSFNNIYISIINFNGIINRLVVNNVDMVYYHNNYENYFNDNRYIECSNTKDYNYLVCDLYKNAFWDLKSYHDDGYKKEIIFQYKTYKSNNTYQLKYTLIDNSLVISYKGPVNTFIPITALKNTFFNIGGNTSSALDTVLMLKSKEIILYDEKEKKDKQIKVKDTHYDFNYPKRIMDNENIKSVIPYIIDKYEKWPIIISKNSKRILIRTKEPLLVLNNDFSQENKGICFDTHCNLSKVDENILVKDRNRIKEIYETKTEYKFLKDA